jgi:hypothetical protein
MPGSAAEGAAALLHHCDVSRTMPMGPNRAQSRRSPIPSRRAGGIRGTSRTLDDDGGIARHLSAGQLPIPRLTSRCSTGKSQPDNALLYPCRRPTCAPRLSAAQIKCQRTPGPRDACAGSAPGRLNFAFDVPRPPQPVTMQPTPTETKDLVRTASGLKSIDLKVTDGVAATPCGTEAAARYRSGRSTRCTGMSGGV